MEVTIEEVFEAYYACRKNKRNSHGALSFETDYESRLITLYEELLNRTWVPSRSTCFIVTKPVRREVFASPFRDRIVHHLLIRRMESTFEKYFIHDSYACRVGKGTLAAVSRASHFVRSASRNGKCNPYILKLDVQSFFMSIPRVNLYQMLRVFVKEVYAKNVPDSDVSLELYLIEKIVLNNPSVNCIFKSPKSEWTELPSGKSLFTAKEGCGIPIGNLTSQIFANFYLSPLDHYAKHCLQLKRYIRYVDDIVIICSCSLEARLVVKKLKSFLEDKLLLTFNKKKIYIQQAKNGFPFLGAFVKPFYTLCSRRIKNNFVKSLSFYNMLAKDHKPCKEEKSSFRSSVNSYLGIMKHCKSYRFRTKQLTHFLPPNWSKIFQIKKNALKIHLTPLSRQSASLLLK